MQSFIHYTKWTKWWLAQACVELKDPQYHLLYDVFVVEMSRMIQKFILQILFNLSSGCLCLKRNWNQEKLSHVTMYVRSICNSKPKIIWLYLMIGRRKFSVIYFTILSFVIVYEKNGVFASFLQNIKKKSGC